MRFLPTVRDWLDLLLGPGFQARVLPATIAGVDSCSIPAAAMAARVSDLFEKVPLVARPLATDLPARRRNSSSGRKCPPSLTPAAMPESTAISSSTGSSIGWNYIGGCSCGWPGSGNALNRPTWQPRRLPVLPIFRRAICRSVPPFHCGAHDTKSGCRTRLSH